MKKSSSDDTTKKINFIYLWCMILSATEGNQIIKIMFMLFLQQRVLNSRME